jgi:hypothetical protein
MCLCLCMANKWMLSVISWRENNYSELGLITYLAHSTHICFSWDTVYHRDGRPLALNQIWADIITGYVYINICSYIIQNFTRTFSIPFQFCLRLISALTLCFQFKCQNHNVVFLSTTVQHPLFSSAKCIKLDLRHHLTNKICVVCVALRCWRTVQKCAAVGMSWKSPGW